MKGRQYTQQVFSIIICVFCAALLCSGYFNNIDTNRVQPDGVEGSIAAVDVKTADDDLQYWHLSRVSVDEAWEITTGKEDVVVAVLDTGINDAHPVLEGRVIAEMNFSSSPVVEDLHGHGTHVAGIIAGGFTELGQVNGVAYDCKLLNVKVANDDGTVEAAAVARGIRWAVENGADIINVSLTIYNNVAILGEAVDLAWRSGVLIIAAAGNRYTIGDAYPAMYPNVVAVAATDNNDRLASWSKRGDWVDVSAPGAAIYSTVLENQYGYQNGTSMSAALVSGEAALLYSVAVDANENGRVNDEVKQAILDSCDEMVYKGIESRLINVFEAVKTLDEPAS